MNPRRRKEYLKLKQFVFNHTEYPINELESIFADIFNNFIRTGKLVLQMPHSTDPQAGAPAEQVTVGMDEPLEAVREALDHAPESHEVYTGSSDLSSDESPSTDEEELSFDECPESEELENEDLANIEKLSTSNNKKIKSLNPPVARGRKKNSANK